MNEIAALIMACAAPLGAGLFASFFRNRKKPAAAVLLLFCLPAMLLSFSRPLILISVFSSAVVSFFLFFSGGEKDTQKTDELEEEKQKTLALFNREKEEFDKAAESEREFSALYIIIKTLSESFDLKSSASILKEKISLYLSAGPVSMFVVEGDRAVKIFGDAKDSEVIEKTSGFENDDFILRGDEAFYAFRDNGAVFFFFSISSASQKGEVLRGKLNDLSTEIFPAIKRISLFRKIDELAVIDGLTGVYRRGAFDEKLAAEFSRARAFKTSLGLMILDIDHFKRVNDTYGHQAGDAILRKTAQLLKESVYETDFVARYGGEEFAVIMPRAQAEGAMRKAEYIRKLIEAEVFDAGIEKLKITVSAGLAHYPQDAGDIKELISRADSALYKAKESGRNRICQWGES